MTVSASDIVVGRCYITGMSSELRRVLSVSEFQVRYEVLSAERGPVMVSREKFASEVDREVACP